MKTISDILKDLPFEAKGPLDVGITDIACDSRKVKAGSLFVALRGVHEDGHAYIPAAIKAGAVAVLCDTLSDISGITQVKVASTLEALARVSVRFWDNPSNRLRMVGITGTNGKTTTSYLIEAIFQQHHWPTGVLGTINYRLGEDQKPAPNTTPFANDLQRFLSSVVTRGGKACVMEVSSHALALNRVDGVEFDVAVFTNLTQDHLDFHKTMERYAEAKKELFKRVAASPKKTPKRAVINADDAWSESMVKGIDLPLWRYRLHGPADLYTTHLVCDASGSRFDLHTPHGHAPVSLPLLGEYNVMNALAAAGAALALDVPLKTVVQGLEQTKGVPGRMERIVGNQPFTVVVDYAHTDDALRKVLNALRRLKPGRLIVVFGCGGDRDRTKRPLMGEAAAQLCDEVIVTSDNPRSEEPAKIVLDIEVGVRRVRQDHYDIIIDREKAIAHAISIAKAGDIICLAGKGHENYQILTDRTIPFDDREVAKRLLDTSEKTS